MVMFSGMSPETGAELTLDHTKLTVLGTDMPGLWYGNIVMDTYIISSEINNTLSGLLVVANYSSMTQAFSHFVGYDENPALAAAETNLYVTQSALYGDLVSYNGSTINFCLEDYSAWTGKGYSGYETAYISVSLDATSNWTLTGPTTVSIFTDSDTTFSNVFSNGYNVYYDIDEATNDYLDGKTYTLNGGGKLRPQGAVSARASHSYWGGYGAMHQKHPAATAAPWGVQAPGNI